MIVFAAVSTKPERSACHYFILSASPVNILLLPLLYFKLHYWNLKFRSVNFIRIMAI